MRHETRILIFELEWNPQGERGCGTSHKYRVCKFCNTHTIDRTESFNLMEWMHRLHWDTALCTKMEPDWEPSHMVAITLDIFSISEGKNGAHNNWPPHLKIVLKILFNSFLYNNPSIQRLIFEYKLRLSWPSTVSQIKIVLQLFKCIT